MNTAWEPCVLHALPDGRQQDARMPKPRADNDSTPPKPRVVAVLFDAALDGHRVDPGGLNGDPLREDQLLWVDLQGGASPPAVLGREGIDAGLLDGRPVGCEGVVSRGGWTYLYAAALCPGSGHRTTVEPLAIALCDDCNVVVTAHGRAVGFIDTLLENEAEHLRVGALQAGSFAASLLDRMLTGYLDARDLFESAVDRIELQVLRRPRPVHLSELQQLRRHASRLRRHLAGQRDMFDALGRPDFASGQSGEETRHWQAVSARYDRTMAAAESARDLVNGSFDVYASRVAEGTNETMRVLTVVTVVLGTLAVVAGVLGMNFEADVFETGDEGFWGTVAVMVAAGVVSLGIGLGWSFWRRR